MSVLALIANPAASSFTGGLHRTVVRILRRKYEVVALWPRSAADARLIAAQQAEEGVEVVAAMGGDGIVHQVANGVAGTGTTLAVLPAGTTNVYAQLLGIPRSTTKAARLLVEDSTTGKWPLVTIEIEMKGETTSHQATFAVGLGFDAEIVEAAEAEPYRKYRFGAIHYARTALGLIVRRFPQRLPNLAVAAGNRRSDAAGLMVQFLSCYTYLGRRPLRFHSETPDPMSVLLLDHLRLRNALPMLLGSALGRDLGNVEGFTLWRGVSELTVEAEPPVAVQADGERLGPTQHATLRHVPDALTVAVPASTR